MPNPSAFRSRAPQQPRRHVEPPRTIERARCQQAKPSAKRVQCRQCAKVFCDSAVVTDAPVQHAEELTWSVVRRLYCDHCHHVQLWSESSTVDGTPFGVVVSGPGFLRDKRAVARFLQQHPEAQGVE